MNDREDSAIRCVAYLEWVSLLARVCQQINHLMMMQNFPIRKAYPVCLPSMTCWELLSKDLLYHRMQQRLLCMSAFSKQCG